MQTIAKDLQLGTIMMTGEKLVSVSQIYDSVTTKQKMVVVLEKKNGNRRQGIWGVNTVIFHR
jgi:hypothetical protein